MYRASTWLSEMSNLPSSLQSPRTNQGDLEKHMLAAIVEGSSLYQK
jgi:hypothetical protein